jgi:hypothetical protein
VLSKARDLLDADPGQVAASEDFAADGRRLDDTLLGEKLLSQPGSVDLAALTIARSGYTALRRAVDGQNRS